MEEYEKSKLPKVEPKSAMINESISPLEAPLFQKLPTSSFQENPADE